MYSQLTQDQKPTFEKIYFYINPTEDRNVKLLKEIQLHKFHLIDLPQRISQEQIMSGSDVTPEDLLKFPKFVKN